MVRQQQVTSLGTPDALLSFGPPMTDITLRLFVQLDHIDWVASR